MQYASHRTLSPNTAELRCCEELWAGRNLDALWHAAGLAQMGRSDPLYVLLVDMETSLVRATQGLPTGAMDLDMEETFGTMLHAQPVCETLQGTQIQGEDLVLMHEMLNGSTVVVQKGSVQAAPVKLRVGIPEGRKLGPGIYVVGAAGLARTDAIADAGVGLDPPSAAVTEFHLSADGTDSAAPNVALARQLWNQVVEGNIDWRRAMASAGDDATRLRLLDVASQTRVGMAQFLDDTTVRDSSWGDWMPQRGRPPRPLG